MYTAQLISDTKSLELRSRLISVQFTEPYTEEVLNETTGLMETVAQERVRVQEFRFKIDETVEAMKKAVKAFLDELNYVLVEVNGDIATVTPDVPVEPTAAEVARTEWDADLEKLKKVQELIDLGVLTGTETPVKNLQAKVKADFKPAYIA